MYLDLVDRSLELPRDTSRWRVRRLADCTRIVIHHTAGPDDEPPEVIARYHLRRGWAGVGYHYLVYRGGHVVKTRPVAVIPACVRGSNATSICIAAVGDYERIAPTAALTGAMWTLVRLLRRAYSVTELGGHREYAATICPGRHLMSVVIGWREGRVA